MPMAYYFGCSGRAGHFLHDHNLWHVDERSLPWRIELMDTGLLKNGKHIDIVDGKVFWTCAKGDWFAFIWWDRSGDSRPNSNSGFYVKGFEFDRIIEAFNYALSQFPTIVERQTFKLELQP